MEWSPLVGKERTSWWRRSVFLVGGKTDLGDSALDFFQNGEIVAVGVAAVVDDEIVEIGLGLIAVKAGVMDDDLDQRLILVLERDSLVGFGEAGLAVLGAVTLFGGLRLGVGLGLLIGQHQAALETSDIQDANAGQIKLMEQHVDLGEIILTASMAQLHNLANDGRVVVDQRLLVEITTGDVETVTGEPGAVLLVGRVDTATAEGKTMLQKRGVDEITICGIVFGSLVGLKVCEITHNLPPCKSTATDVAELHTTQRKLDDSFIIVNFAQNVNS